MTELIAHEIEITAIDRGQRHEAYHLMQRHASLYGIIVVAHHHMPIHLLVDQTEDDSLVAHESLVVAFTVADSLFIGTSVGEFPKYGSRMPVFIPLLFDHFNPVVGHTHSHTVIKAHAAVGKLRRQTRHTAHLLGDSDGVGIDVVDQNVGQREIGQSVGVLIAVVIIAIAPECLPQTVVVI